MRTIKITFLVTIFLTTVSFGQNFPKTPATPNSGDMHTNVTSTVSNSTSVSNGNDLYVLTSKFQKTKRKGILDLLEDKLDNIKPLRKSNTILWRKVEKGITVFECKLTSKTLKISMNKDEVSSRFSSEIESLGDELVNFISAHKSFEYSTTKSLTSVSSAQLRLENAKEELKRSIRNLEKVKRKKGN